MTLTGTTLQLTQLVGISATEFTYSSSVSIPNGTRATVYLRTEQRDQEQWVDVNFDTANHAAILILSRAKVDGLSETATITWQPGATGEIVVHGADRPELGKDNAYTGDQAITGDVTFPSTTTHGLGTAKLTTTERDALTGVPDGAIIFNITLDVTQIFFNSQWNSLGVSTPPPTAADTIKGLVDIATLVEQQNGTAVDATSGAQNALVVAQTTKVSAGAGDHGKVVLLEAAGEIDATIAGATKTEIAQALSGISANLTAAKLGNVVGGGNADTEHIHSILKTASIPANSFIASGGSPTLSADTDVGAGATYTLDQNITESIIVTIPIPSQAGTSITSIVLKTWARGTTGNVVLNISTSRNTDGGATTSDSDQRAYSGSGGTAFRQHDIIINAAAYNATDTLFIAGDTLRLKIERVGGDGSDTLAADLLIMAAAITF